MRQILNASLLLTVAMLSVGLLSGCSGENGTQTVKVAPNTPPPKGSFPDVIQNNPNIPESAKKSMLNQGAGSGK